MAARRQPPVSRMTNAQIAALLERDGYYDLIGREAEIRCAASQGSLLWTRERLTVTMPSRSIDLDARPDR